MEFVVTHRAELTWVACGLLLGAVLAPLHGLVTGPFCAGCDLVYKWTGIVPQCFKCYRSYILSPEVQDAGTLHRWWMLSESLLGTPMIELVVQDEHQHGLGRVVYKFCDAFHAYFYVFIPETGEYGWRATTQYKEALHSKWGDAIRRAWFMLCTGWALIQTTGYVVTYSLLSAYDLMVTVCLGWFGVVTVIVAANYYVGNGQGLVLYGEFEIGWWPALGRSLVMLTGLTSRACRWLAYTSPSPLAKIGDLCEQLKETMENRAQIEHLALAFWKEDGGVGPVPRDAVEALRAARAAGDAARESRVNHRELWKEVRAVGEANEEPRRGRRSTVGEDVPSGNGPYRSARANYCPRSDVAGNQMFETLPCEAARLSQ